jgi:hypothetical protein
MEIPHIPLEDAGEAPEAAEKPAPAPAVHRPRGGPVVATLRHRWPEYLLEMVVIVLSISISFGLDQWKERRREAELEQLYLKTLADNLASDIDKLHEVIPETQLVLRKAQGLLDRNRASAPVTPAQEDLLDIARRPSFLAHDAAFSDLRSSGNLRVIHDFGLKNAVFDYYGEYDSIRAKEASERESLITLVAPLLLRKISFGLDTAGPRPPGSPPVPAVHNDREFNNAMYVRLHERGELLADYRKELDLAERLRRRIAREIH